MDFLDAGKTLAILQKIKNRLGEEEFNKLKIVLGDDEELNGVHNSFFIELAEKKDFNNDYLDLDLNDIEERFILIS